jgi:hypothetical protein
MDKDLQKAIERLKLAKKYEKDGEKFFGEVTFHIQKGIIGHTTIKQVIKDG